MKLLQNIMLGLTCLLLTAQTGLATMQAKGANGKLEWGMVGEFQLSATPVDIAHSLDGKYAFILTSESEVLVYDNQGALQGTMPVNNGVTSIALDPLGQNLYMADSEQNTFTTIAIDFVVGIKAANAPFKGKVDAPVLVAVFSDFQ